MISVFASMLRERRIIFISRRISQLSSCVIAANMLIYPMHWLVNIFLALSYEFYYFLNLKAAHLHSCVTSSLVSLLTVGHKCRSIQITLVKINF